ncbi:unnamed protein product [Ambrosiozyma monospora]|uniref:Unnamed protein product n=1 Tax=Ambrosiozyma monospora TaxID=43982 RepID=A0A9W6SZY7_AMBMO|nr:unnamed protein product [Ambrosiozyma monospora]
MSLSPGFKAVFYKYEMDDSEDFSQSTFYSVKYRRAGATGTASGIVEPTLSISPEEGVVQDGTIWGVDLTVSNYTLELSGFFKPQISGIYTFHLNKIDDGAMVWLGQGAFLCCLPSAIPSNSVNDRIMWVTKPYQDDSLSETVSVYLDADTYYPMRIVYINIISFSILDFSIEDPDGTLITDFSDYIWQATDLSALRKSCSSTTASLVSTSSSTTTTTLGWTGTDTTTTTFTTTVTSVKTPYELDVVEVLTPQYTTTTTEPWTDP